MTTCLEFMCEASNSSFVSALFTKGPAAPGGSKGGSAGKSAPKARRMTKMPATIAVKFKDQLGTLNKELLRTDPHYIRCINKHSDRRL